MLIKIDVESDLFRRIQALIDSGKYDNIHQFIKLAINNQIQEEASELSTSKSSRIIPKSSQKIPESDEERQDMIVEHLGDFPAQESQIEPEANDMIWGFYSRFFPVKVVIYKLASMLSEQKTWIEISEIQEEAFDFVETISLVLKNYEASNQLPRNKKLSTGLPMPHLQLPKLRGSKRKKEKKYHSSKIRFMEQFVGKPIKKEPYSFKGACFSMGLMAVKFVEETCYVSLTREGKDFAFIANPIINEYRFDSSFSDQEIRFIFHNIYPKFVLENKIIHKIINTLKQKDLKSDEIDVFFEEENRKDVTVERVATMGRLSELQIVNWKINTDRSSIYSLNEDKLSLIN